MSIDRPVDRVVDLTDKWNQIALRELVRIGETYTEEPRWATGDELAWQRLSIYRVHPWPGAERAARVGS